jgi:hypothetical protein
MSRFVPVAVCGALGAAWAWNHALGANAAALVIGFHLAAGVALLWCFDRWLRGISGRWPGLGASLAAVLALGVVPALAADLDVAALGAPKALAALLAGGGVAALAGMAAARFGPLAAAFTAAGGTAAVLALAPTPLDVLQKRATVAITPEHPIAGRVAVLGIDGGDWRVIDPLIARGEMPHLARLIERGASGVLRSIEPMYSPVVWSSIFSGKTPEKHGISDWYSSHAANRRASLLWEAVGEAGLESVVVNVPGSWPPAPVRGALISGFPIPSVLRPPSIEQQQVLGQVFTTHPRVGALVPTELLAGDASRAQGSVVAGEAMLQTRTRLRHPIIEMAQRRNWLPPREKRFDVRLEDGQGDLRRVQIDDHQLELRSGEWSPWLRDDVFGQPVRFRVRGLADGSVYSTPLFQDPRAPMHPFTDDPALLAETFRDDMYVVEPAGWRVADDRDLRGALFEHLVDVEEQHLQAAQRLVQQLPAWRLLAHVFTITDRISHAFWRFHQPEAYAPMPADELAADRTRVESAYRVVDAALGRLLATLGDDVTVLIVSDHGFQAEAEKTWGWHRPEGIWIASGPGVRGQRERIEMSVLDVTPTVLAALGLPAGKDMDGHARADLFEPAPALAVIDSYEADEPGAAAPRKTRIDESTVDQLRSLGYVQ